MADYLQGPLPRGELYVTISDLTEEQVEQMLDYIGRAKDKIAWLKSHYQLELRMDDVRSMIMGQLGSMWENLHNIRPRNLSGYGEVTPELFETLEPKLLEIVDVVNIMSSIISPNNKLR